jgi:hypothetical protein
VVIMTGVYVIGDLSTPVAPIQDRPPDAVGLASAGLNCVTELS